MERSSQRRGGIAIFIGALLWSTGGLFIKEVTLDAWGVSFWRSSFAATTLFLIYLAQRGSFADTGRWFTRFNILSALCYALLLVLFVIATKLTTSANAIFLQYTAPIYVLFAEPLLSRTRMKRTDLITVLISTSAMALFFVGKFEARSILGNVIALASGVAFAGYTLLLKHDRATEGNRLQIVVIGHAIIVVAMALIASAGVTSLAPGAGDMPRLLYLGIVQIGIAYAFFTYGIAHVRAIDATLIAMIEPVLNPVWVFLGIGERPSNFAILGGLIILSLSIIRTVRGSTEVVNVESVRSGE